MRNARPDSARRRGHVVPTAVLATVSLASSACEGPFDRSTAGRIQPARRPASVATSLPVPDLRLPTMDGDTLVLRSFAGEGVTVLNFWATWCVPCRKEMPALVRLHRRREDAGVRVVGIAVASPDTGEIRTWIDRYELTFPTLYGLRQEEMSSSFGSFGVPRTYIIAGDRIRFEMIGSRTLPELEAVVDSLAG